jgi:hypothetical protein
MDDVLRGLIYTHNRANANTTEVHETRATVEALAALLVDSGVVDANALARRRQEAAEGLRGRYVERGMAVAMMDYGVSKYDFSGGVAIDCEDRMPLCRAACCRLPFALSREDVQEGIVRWDLGQPYFVAQRPDGCCVHLGDDRRCTVYDQRPVPCRGYDCRKDNRIWLDFENRVVNPRIAEPGWPSCLDEDALPVVS